MIVSGPNQSIEITVAFLEGKEGHRMKLARFPRELRPSIP